MEGWMEVEGDGDGDGDGGGEKPISKTNQFLYLQKSY